MEKVQGFGRQHRATFTVVAYVPPLGCRRPHRAIAAAGGAGSAGNPAAHGRVEARTLDGLAPAHPFPVRQAVHWGSLLVEAQAHQPAVRLLPVSDTLARPVRR